jgi:hypothetical protein
MREMRKGREKERKKERKSPFQGSRRQTAEPIFASFFFSFSNILQKKKKKLKLTANEEN